jgi:hypothetical protein
MIGSVVTYACPVWELAADTCLLQLQHLQNNVLRIIGNFSSCTPIRDLHTAFKLLNIYDYITKLSRQQAEVIQNYETEHVRSIGQGEARHIKYEYKSIKLGGGQTYDHSSDYAAIVA